MRLLPDFIAELIRAANTIHKLTTHQRRRMLGRAYVEILERYVKSNGETPPGGLDPAAEFLRATGHVKDLSDDEVKELLLDAAEMIRTLRIAMDTATLPTSTPHVTPAPPSSE
jgi:hypothetical protein